MPPPLGRRLGLGLGLGGSLAALLVLGLPGLAGAQDLDEMLEEFEQEEEITIESAEDGPPRFWELDGALSAQMSWSYRSDARKFEEVNYEGISVLKTQLALELDFNLPRAWKARIAGRGFYDAAYAIEGRSKFRGRTLEQHETELEFQEIWIGGSLLPSLDLKFGRQIVNWGRSESLRILDVLNPLDNREPGLVDIEDLRLPVTMTKLDYYFGPWQLTGIAVHEIRFSENPAFGSEFNPSPIELPPEQEPGNGGSNTEWAAALTGNFSGWDFSLHYARYFSDGGYLEILSLPPPLGAGSLSLVTRHARQTLIGASVNVALGNWLLKSEAAQLRDVRFIRSSTPILGFSNPKTSRYDILGGVEYSGFNDQTLVLEVANRHVARFDDRFGLPALLAGLLATSPVVAQRNQLETTLRYSADMLNQRLHFTFLALMVDEWAHDGGFMRFAFDYELRDALNVGAGLVLYIGGDLPTFAGIKNNDRFYLTAKYSF